MKRKREEGDNEEERSGVSRIFYLNLFIWHLTIISRLSVNFCCRLLGLIMIYQNVNPLT
uniref:T30E16.36 n=1 Tax=Arabidopsis thaliana TaxID=3702 RepID=Q9LQ38_ARATH|nr:T30E16.36 [Arabidopsis thaliana]